MKKFAILLSILIIIFAVYIFSDPNSNIPPVENHPISSAQVGDVVEFTGTLTDFNDNCKIDISCTAYVDGIAVTTHPGHVRDPLPLGKSDVWNEDIGKIVRVKAKKIGSRELTIEGSEEYFVVKNKE